MRGHSLGLVDLLNKTELMSDRTLAIPVVEIPGRLVYGDNEGILKETIDDLLNQGDRRIVLDLEKVSFIDSSGLADLVSAHKSVAQAGGALKLVRVNRKVRSVLTITNLLQVMQVFEDEAEALKSCQE